MLRIALFFALVIALFTMPALAQKEDTIEVRQWATSAEASSEYGADGWSAAQATGEPNSDVCGDSSLAWASAIASEQASLTVMFSVAVVPTQINIHQNYNPGSITGIDLITSDGGELIQVTDSGDPGGMPCPGVLAIDILGEAPPVNGVIIYVDQAEIGNWNEIDAVELVGTVTPGIEVSMWADEAQASSQYGDTSWSAAQATGAPDTEGCADAVTAWASATSSGIDELDVYFPIPVIPTHLDIYQTYNPGSITGVDLLLEDGSVVPVTNSADTGTECPGVFSLSIETEVAAIGVAIHVDQTEIANWNEIDAVQLTGIIALPSDILRQWATGASATSEFGKENWSAFQATGEPNTDQCGDFTTAWASATSTEQAALTVTFDEPVVPTSIHIYQSFNPGAITGIELIPADGSGPITVTDSADPGNIPCPGVMVIDILGDVTPVNGVTIYLDQSITNNWNEIDAVQLIGRRAE
jgi:hypothetical protein